MAHVFLKIIFRVVQLFVSSPKKIDNPESRLRALHLQSVESKLGRTGESELAERETGERRSFLSAFARFAQFPRSRDHLGQFALSSPAKLRLD